MSSQNASKRVRVGAVSDFADGQRMLVPNGDYTIGVFRVDGGFRAYDNVCLHQGGPVCEGRYFPLMTAVVDEGGRALGERYDESEPHLVCPWHGWEYDPKTGQATHNANARVAVYPLKIENGDVMIEI